MQSNLNAALGEALAAGVVVPVLTIETPDDGVEVARALERGGLNLIEITLRTPAAVEVIRRIAAEVPQVRVGAGTVLDPEQAAKAIEAGARFIVSPGMTPRLLEAADKWPVPYLPGVATASEAMALSDLGYRALKFFPAEPAGGVTYLKALAAPLRGISFCPTGGIDASNAAAYLALPNVAAVGGSWVAPAKEIGARDWLAITGLAHQAASLRAKR
ncbi:MAG: bifunctional 4-hydroxy-2-oxoglutarate aldolase/2-dehydro-3-deoxy-phosphogluconate aldolase [Bacteroidota bacterium]|jgi:2-dehydro-3-deoxyphosphogluconate aldolase/(4S)-4-hydroxy-2-oxoglutarate aldolase